MSTPRAIRNARRAALYLHPMDPDFDDDGSDLDCADEDFSEPDQQPCEHAADMAADRWERDRDARQP